MLRAHGYTSTPDWPRYMDSDGDIQNYLLPNYDVNVWPDILVGVPSTFLKTLKQMGKEVPDFSDVPLYKEVATTEGDVGGFFAVSPGILLCFVRLYLI